MRSQRSSLDRLRDKEAIRLFISLFAHHGVLGYREAQDAQSFSESDRLRTVPLVFGLLPREAIFRPRDDSRVKPVIRAHLGSLGIEASEQLVEVLKRISDQYYRTVVCRIAGAASLVPRKRGIEDLRALRSEYALLRARQGGRCAVCGLQEFDDVHRETLDHVIPWFLIGDVFDGSNWQIVCSDCNAGKREWISSLQSSQALNWFVRG